MIFLELSIIHVYEIDFVFLSLRLFFNTIPGKFENIIATTSTGAIQLVRTHRRGREGHRFLCVRMLKDAYRRG
jgi:hypothetical protein